MPEQNNVTEKYYNELLNISEITEKIVSFYGEEFREKITKRLKETDLILIPRRLERYKLQKEIFQRFSKASLDAVEKICNMDFGLRVGGFNPKHIIKNQEILTAIGIDISNFIINENGEYVWKFETSLMDFARQMRATFSNVDWVQLGIETDFIIDGEEIKKDVAIELAYDFLKKSKELANNLSRSPAPKEGVENNAELINNLAKIINSSQTINLQQANNLQDVSGLNFETRVLVEIFGVSPSGLRFAGVQDLLKEAWSQAKRAEMAEVSLSDEQKMFILGLIQKLQSNHNNNIEETKTVVDLIYRKLINGDETLAFASNCSTLNSEKPSICIPLDDKLDLSTILHEMGHIIQGNSNGVVSLAGGINGGTGFNDGTYDSIMFNEVVNEYLTKEMLNEHFKDYDFPLTKEGEECYYTSGVELFEPFLNVYKDVLKKAVLNENPQEYLLSNTNLDENTLDKIAQLVKRYMNCYDKKYFAELTKQTGLEILSPNDIIKNWEELSKYEFSGNLLEFVNLIAESKELCAECINLLQGETHKSLDKD